MYAGATCDRHLDGMTMLVEEVKEVEVEVEVEVEEEEEEEEVEE